jgi:hypothetical protein
MSHSDKITTTGIFRFFETGQDVLGLPCRARARFFINRGTLKARWQDSAGYYPAFRLRAKIFKLALRILVSFFPQLFVFPRGEDFCEPDAAFDFDALRKKFSALDRCVVMLGATDDNRRKAIVCLKGLQQTSLAYIKWGVRPLAQKKVLNEGRMLAVLPAHTGPGILYEWSVSGEKAICLTAITGKGLPKYLPEVSDRKYWDDIVSFLMKFSNGSREVCVSEHPWIKRLMQRTLFDFAEVLVPLQKSVWPVIFSHGDLTPWNLVRVESGQLIAIDWEDGTDDGFLWADLAYYVIQTGTLMHKWSASKIRTYLSSLLGFYGVEESVAQAIVRLVSLDSYLKGIEDGISPECRLQKTRKELWECV